MIRIRQMLAGAMLVLLSVLVLVNPGEAQWQTPQYSVPLGRGAGTGFNFAAPGTAGVPFVSNGGTSYPSFNSAYALRERLTASRNYYVRVDGNDNCNGLVNTAGSSGGCAFLTLQKPIDVIQQTLDLVNHNVTINVGNSGGYERITLTGPFVGNGTVSLLGNTTTPTNVVIGTGAGAAITCQDGAALTVSGFSVTSSVTHTIQALRGCQLFLGKMNYGTSAGGTAQIYSTRRSYVELNDNFTISGGIYNFMQATHGGEIRMTGAITGTFTADVTYDVSTGFAYATSAGAIVTTGGAAFALGGHTIVGKEYSMIEGGIIEAAGLMPPAVDFFPGNTVGDTTLNSSKVGPTVWWTNTILLIPGGTGGLCFNKNDNTTTTFCVNNAGAATWPGYSAGLLYINGSNAMLPVTQTSGGIPYFDSTSTVASSAALAANRIVLGGGAGASPATLGSLGTTTTVLHGNAAGAPSYGPVTGSDMSNNTVANAQLAQMANARIKCRTTAGTGNAEDCTAAQVGALFTKPTRQVFTSGSGTYTTPANTTWIKVTMVGGGGGGSGSGTTPGPGTAGGNTTFGSALLTAGGGQDGGTSTAGGTASGCDLNITGGAGQAGANIVNQYGGDGGASMFGGLGAGGAPAVAGNIGKANTGSGGGGGGDGATVNAGNGGGAGAFCDKLIGAPSATYSYAVGAGGTGGAAGTGGASGGAGGSGHIMVEEHHNFLLKRDLAPAANDNTPMWLNAAA